MCLRTTELRSPTIVMARRNRTPPSEQFSSLRTTELRSLAISMVQRDRAPPSERFSRLRTTELRSPTTSMVQRDKAPPSERVSLNRPPALRLVLGESTGLFGFGLERFSRDQARRHFALATSCFQEEHCKTEQGIGLLTISVRQRAANLD